MATAYTSLLGLALPVTGELSGTWGTTVNDAITSLLDTAVAGTTTISSDADVTLTTTTGASNTSRQAVLLWTAGGTATRTITAPAQSKTYIVINKTSSTQSIKLVGVGPTTGVTIVAGESAVCAWNGLDFIKISNTSGAGTFTNLTVTGNTILGDASADTVTVNGTLTSNLIFTDNTYDIGASGATRPRTGYFGTSVFAPLVDATNLEVTNIKALDGTANISIANSTGIATFSKATIVETTDNTNAALRITQMGTGNALLVEDNTNPDTTPFAIDSNGYVIAGYTTTVGFGSGSQPLINVVSNADNSGNGLLLAKFRNSTNASSLDFIKSRSSSLGTNTIVQSGDTLGAVLFSGADGTSYIQAASINASVDGTPGTGDMPGRLVFSTTADGASSPTERMRIGSAGNVGIGGAAAAGQTVQIVKAITGSVNGTAIRQQGVVQSDVTSSVFAFDNVLQTVASSFTLSAYNHFNAQQATIGAGSAITSQIGFSASSTLIGATSNYGFVGDIPAGTNRWNFYAGGTANNYFAGKVGIGDTTPSVSLDISATDAIRIPVGTTGERPTGVNGYLRFNTTTTQFEGYDGSAWAAVGGGSTITNDTSTATNVYPLFANATSGSATTIFTGNAKLLYKPSTGELQASVPVALNGIVVNSQTVATSYTIAAGYSGMSAGPVTVASGQAVTVSSGSRWVIQ